MALTKLDGIKLSLVDNSLLRIFGQSLLLSTSTQLKDIASRNLSKMLILGEQSVHYLGLLWTKFDAIPRENS